MIFQLTADLEDKILHALEDQGQEFLVESESSSLVPACSVVADEDNYYSLPRWDSSDGFSLRENFVNELNSPFAQKELRKVMHSGRGVFKGFKNVLKDYPLVEKAWHRYKNLHMREYIGDWYNQLREIWGLERLETEIENLDNLIDGDFVFQNFDSKKGSAILHEFLDAATQDFELISDEKMQKVLKEMISNQFMEGCSGDNVVEQSGILCRTLSEEFAGIITSKPISGANDECMLITSLFVAPQYRGLGIGTRLLQQHLTALKKLGKNRILLTYSMIPEVLEPFLLSSGFRKIGSGFFSEIQ